MQAKKETSSYSYRNKIYQGLFFVEEGSLEENVPTLSHRTALVLCLLAKFTYNDIREKEKKQVKDKKKSNKKTNKQTKTKTKQTITYICL